MHKILISAAAAALAIGLPATAHAQQANILVVDSDRLMSDCTACKAASTQLQSRQAALRTRAQTLQTQLEAEGKPIQAAVDALNGKDPDAALQAKITAFETKRRNSSQELQTSTNSLQSTVAHVQQQIGQKIVALVAARLSSCRRTARLRTTMRST